MESFEGGQEMGGEGDAWRDKGRALTQSLSEWLSKMANGMMSQQMETLKPCHYIQA